jgi:hypothetical protein
VATYPPALVLGGGGEEIQPYTSERSRTDDDLYRGHSDREAAERYSERDEMAPQQQRSDTAPPQPRVQIDWSGVRGGGDAGASSGARGGLPDFESQASRAYDDMVAAREEAVANHRDAPHGQPAPPREPAHGQATFGDGRHLAHRAHDEHHHAHSHAHHGEHGHQHHHHHHHHSPREHAGHGAHNSHSHALHGHHHHHEHGGHGHQKHGPHPEQHQNVQTQKGDARVPPVVTCPLVREPHYSFMTPSIHTRP